MRKTVHILIPFIFLIFYFCFGVICWTVIADPLLADTVSGVIVIGLCLLHNRFSCSEPYRVLSLSEIFFGFFLLVFVWFIVTVTGSVIQMRFPTESAVLDTTGLYVIFAVFVAPVLEELLFRGILFRHIREGFSLFAAYVVSSLVFAVLHGTYHQVYGGLFCGALFSFIYHYTGQLKWNIIAHMFYNMMAFLGVFISVPDVVFQPGFVIPSNIVMVCALFGIIIYFEAFAPAGEFRTCNKLSEKKKSAPKVRGTDRVSMLILSFKKSFLSLRSPTVSVLVRSLNGDIHISLHNQMGSCLYAGYIRDLNESTHRDILALRIVPASGSSGVQYYNGLSVPHISFMVKS